MFNFGNSYKNRNIVPLSYTALFLKPKITLVHNHTTSRYANFDKATYLSDAMYKRVKKSEAKLIFLAPCGISGDHNLSDI